MRLPRRKGLTVLIALEAEGLVLKCRPAVERICNGFQFAEVGHQPDRDAFKRLVCGSLHLSSKLINTFTLACGH